MIRDHFDSTYSRNETGRFVIRLPVKPNIVNLRGSFNKAKAMLIKSENRKSESLRNAYCTFMSEYENLGHMTKLENFNFDNVNCENSYFFPHHMVLEKTGSTTSTA